MPQWTPKEERQYEHIKESARKRGENVRRAKEIAARTVNKVRREHGETPAKTSQGTGNPNRPLEERSRDELYNLAQQKKIPGRSRMNKAELIEAVRSQGH